MKGGGLELIILQFPPNSESLFPIIFALILLLKLKLLLDEQFLDLELGIFLFLCNSFPDAFFSFLWVCAAKGNLDLRFGYFLGAQTKLPYHSVFFYLELFICKRRAFS